LEPALPEPSWRDKFAGEEWEAIIGGNWLNKLGALITVIAIALLLSLSLEQLGPPGKIGVGVTTAAILLGLGTWVERKLNYRVFSFGLLAAGWGVLYFTAYAAHAIPASRVIASPTIGLLVLLAVAVAMVARSLRYQSEVLTALTFFAAFVALQVDPASVYALIASAILAAGLLVIAHRHEWNRMALVAILLAYGTVALLPKPPLFFVGIGQPILWVYWALFEVFDLASLRRKQTPLRQFHFVLNSFGFLSASLLATSKSAPPEHYSAFLGLATMAFAISFSLRLRESPGALEERPWLAALTPQGLSLISTTGLAVWTILQRFDRLTATLGLLVVAEFVFLFAWRLGQRLPHWVAVAVSALAAGKLLFYDLDANGRILWMGQTIYAVSPLLAGMSAAYFFNRSIVRNPFYSYAGSMLAMALCAHEIRHPDWIIGWVALGVLLFTLRFWWESYAVLGFTALTSALLLFDPQLKIEWWTWTAATAGFGYVAYRLFRDENAVARRLVLLPATGSASLSAVMLVWSGVPSTLIAPAWGLLALGLLELAAFAQFQELRWCAHVVSAFALGRLFLANFAISGRTGPLSHRLLTVAPFLPYFYYWWQRTNWRIYLWASPLLALFLVRFEVGRDWAAPGAMGLALLLLAWGIPDARWQAYLLAIYAFARLWATNFPAIPASLLTIAAFFAAHQIAQRDRDARLDQYARPGFVILGSFLLAAFLHAKAEGTQLTMAWGGEGIALVLAGFFFRERVMRLSGLALFLFCVLKLFIYDLASLSGLPRVLSFVVLGLLLMAASWLYTRFREQLKRHL
jgi:hypothetical protein